MRSHLNRNFIYLMILWTLIIFGFTYYVTSARKLKDEHDLIAQAQTFSKFIDIAGMWNSSHNGVYVPVTEETPPNPYLADKDRDISGPGGKKLTLQNPAYMIRQFSDLSSQLNGVVFHFSSLTPVNPINSSYKWEVELFNKFKSMDKDSYSWPREKDDNGETYFRYMKSMWTKDSCFECHSERDFKVGDLRGGLSISIPTDKILQAQQKSIMTHWGLFFIIWAIVFLVSLIFHRKLIRTANDKARAQDKLAETKEVEQKLSGAMEMAGAICHELGQPLQAIITSADVLDSDHIEEKGNREMLNIISEQSKALGEICRKLRKVTSYATKKYVGNSEIFDLDKSIK